MRVVCVIEVPRLNNTCLVYLFQVSSFYVFLILVFFGLSTQSGEDRSQGCCLEANIFPLDKNLERLAHSLCLLLLYPPNRVTIVAKAAALRLGHFSSQNLESSYAICNPCYSIHPIG